MKPELWEEFMHTGRVEDYLSYKAMRDEGQAESMPEEKKAGAGNSERNNNRDGDGIVRFSDRGV